MSLVFVSYSRRDLMWVDERVDAGHLQLFPIIVFQLNWGQNDSRWIQHVRASGQVERAQKRRVNKRLFLLPTAHPILQAAPHRVRQRHCAVAVRGAFS